MSIFNVNYATRILLAVTFRHYRKSKKDKAKFKVTLVPW